MTLRADLHMHTVYSSDCDTPPERLVRRCREVGLDCIAITDHNTIRGALEVRKLADFPVIVGEEVMSSEGDIIGLFLEEEIPKGLSPLETVRRIKEQGGLVMVPHPFDTIRRGPLSPAGLAEIMPHVDMTEVLNARTILPGDLGRCRRLASEARITPVAVSDAHTTAELGSAYIEIDGFDGSPDSFKSAVQQARIFGHRSNPLVHMITAYVKVKKRLLRRALPAYLDAA